MKENRKVGENAERKENFFHRHKKATICIVVLLILGIIGSYGEEPDQKEEKKTTKAVETTINQSVNLVPNTSNGTYYGADLDLESHSAKFVFDTGDSYDGEWNKEIPEGKGKYVYKNVGEYDGQFINCQRAGDGQFV